MRKAPGKYPRNILLRAHALASYNRGDIWNSIRCGCFACLEVFVDPEIKHWINDGETALCPKCGIDSVLADYNEYWSPPVRDPDFLKEMQTFWFQVTARMVTAKGEGIVKKPTRVIGVPILPMSVHTQEAIYTNALIGRALKRTKKPDTEFDEALKRASKAIAAMGTRKWPEKIMVREGARTWWGTQEEIDARNAYLKTMRATKKKREKKDWLANLFKK